MKEPVDSNSPPTRGLTSLALRAGLDGPAPEALPCALHLRSRVLPLPPCGSSNIPGMKKWAAQIRRLPWRVPTITFLIAASVASLVVLRHETNWGDLPTWLTALTAGLAAWFALGQLRVQSKQLEDQRRQIEQQQQQINAELKNQVKRDAILDEQLKQAKVATAAIVRQQAQQVDLSFSTTSRGPSSTNWSNDNYHVADVANNSGRPIRNVTCYIEPAGEPAAPDAAMKPHLDSRNSSR